MGLVLFCACFLQDPLEQRIADMLRLGLEAQELSDRLARLGPEASGPIAQRLVLEAARGSDTTAVMSDALARIDTQSAARTILRDALRDPSTPHAARFAVADALLRMRAVDESAVNDEALDAEVRLSIAEGLQARGELAALESVLAALGRIRRDDPELAGRVDALEIRMRRRDEPESLVVDLPEPTPAAPPARTGASAADERSTQANLLIGFGAIALAVVLLATRRRTP